MMVMLKRVLVLYLFFSLARFFIFDESFFSTDRIVIIMVVVIAISSVVYSWLNRMINMDENQKNYRYLISPIKSMLVTYILLSFMRYAILQDTILVINIGIITSSIMVGIIEGVDAKIDDVSPRDPKQEPSKPLKYYIDKFVMNATPFHKTVFVVYGLCIFLLVIVLILEITRVR